MVLADELFQIPAPFDNFSGDGKNSDEAEGIDSIQRQSGEGGIGNIRRGGSAHGIDDFTAAHGIMAGPRGDGVPVDEGQRRATVVQGDPGSTAGFRRTDHGAAANGLFLRWKTSRARKLFV